MSHHFKQIQNNPPAQRNLPTLNRRGNDREMGDSPAMIFTTYYLTL